MHFVSYGAVGEVTGSLHLVHTSSSRILLDCGLFQGRRKESEAKNIFFPFDPQIITNTVLSHAHIDHCGRLPLLCKKQYFGRIVTTRPTVDVCYYLLKDSARIQESDAEYLNYKVIRSFLSQIKSSENRKLSQRQLKMIKKLLKKNSHHINTQTVNELMDKHMLSRVYPLYTEHDVDNALEYFDGYPYNYPITIAPNITCTFYDAGHILGSAMCLLKIKEQKRTIRILFTGDLGRFGKFIIRDPYTAFKPEDRKIDLLIMESTYGNRDHEPISNIKTRLEKVIYETTIRGGSIIIPAFAFGRTQELVYVLHEIYNGNDIPRAPIYVDSPLAINLTKVFGEHPETYNQYTHNTFLKYGQNPFLFDQIHFIQSLEESMALLNESKPHLVISSSGMCEAGRILHHLRYKIHNPNNTILIVGYMAQNTLGRRILELGNAYENSGRQGPPPLVKILNKIYPLKARVKEFGGFSAHADRNDFWQFLQRANLNPKHIVLIHGEEEQLNSFNTFLQDKGYHSSIARYGEMTTI